MLVIIVARLCDYRYLHGLSAISCLSLSLSFLFYLCSALVANKALISSQRRCLS